MDDRQRMKKNLGFMTATARVVGCVIGAGVFFKPYAIYQATGGAPGMGMLAWLMRGRGRHPRRRAAAPNGGIHPAINVTMACNHH